MSRDISDSKIIKFLDRLKKVLDRKVIPKYSSKKSPKKYTQHQHLLLIALKKYLRVSYRELIEYIKVMNNVRRFINLKRIPHYTTIQKAFARVSRVAQIFLIHVREYIDREEIYVALDSTGIGDKFSTYYYKRLNDFGVKKGWIKMAIAVSPQGMVLSYYIGDGKESDHKHFTYLAEKVNAKYVIADKGYDSSKNREFVRHRGGKAIIPYREMNEVCRLGNIKFMKEYGEIYRKRNIVESVFSSMKRRFGGEVFSSRISGSIRR